MKRLSPAAVFLALILTFAASASPANAAFGLSEFDVTFTESEGPDAEVTQQAGAHPYAMTTALHFISLPTGEGGEETEEAAKNIFLTQPRGFVGNPNAVPRCAIADFLTSIQLGTLPVSECPDAAALGLVKVQLSSKKSAAPVFGAVYNLEPPPGVPAKLGFWISGVPVTLDVAVSEEPPFNLVARVTNISQVLEVVGSEVTLWGTPADPVHDSLRGHCLEPLSGGSLGDCPASVSEIPFLTMPRSCDGPLITEYATASWQNPSVFVEGAGESEELTGCGKLAFAPEVRVTPTASAAESASGLEIAIDVADENIENPDGDVAADIETIRLALAQGITINPSAAEGLGVCTSAEFESATLESGGCPEASKLGTIEADTPILQGHTLKGAFYQAASYDNPFGSLLAAYLVIRDPELGVFMKLPTEIKTNEMTGQIEAITENLPPFPLERVRVRLRSGPRAPLITPPRCGTYTSTATLSPSSGGKDLVAETSFAVTSGPGGTPCPPPGPPPFAPGFEAGSTNSAAGAFSPFSARLTRQDGSQDLTRISTTLPPGVTGKIAGLGRCADAAIAAASQKAGLAELASPSCPESSKVGRVVAGAGVGTALTYVEGSLYLAGPYNSAPLSLVSIVPAVAGPFDVGTVVTRLALNLNPETAQVEVDGSRSDPIPHILRGVPLKLRDLRVFTDRPGFTLNPTSCRELSTRGLAVGSGADPFSAVDDVAVAIADRYQASSCASLPFKPKLALSLKGATRRSQNPAFKAVLTARGGDANVRGAEVILPPSQFIDNAHIANPCTRPQFAAGACPPASVLGNARAFTPLLDAPLEGPVYFLSNGGARKLPDVVAALGGQFRFNLVVAVLESRNARIRTKVLNAPDAPVTKFILNMAGGKKGLLENSRNLCRGKQRATLNLTGQNGRQYKTQPVVKTSCGNKQGK